MRLPVTALPIEGLQVGLKIDVQPFDASMRRKLGRPLHQFTADALPLVFATHGSFQDKAVNASVPSDVYESHKK